MKYLIVFYVINHTYIYIYIYSQLLFKYKLQFLVQVIFSLGMAIFKALDFGSNAGEEIALLPDLEALITSMTNCNRGKQIFICSTFFSNT